MASTPESARRASHLRYHVNKGVLNPKCALCQGAAAVAGLVIPTAPVISQPTFPPPLPDFDKERAESMASRQRTLEEAAMIFNLPVETFRKEIRQGFGAEWEQIVERAPT